MYRFFWGSVYIWLYMYVSFETCQYIQETNERSLTHVLRMLSNIHKMGVL